MSEDFNLSRSVAKTRRLCRAAERVVVSVIAEAEALTGCVVLDVVPASASRLLVRVGLPGLASADEFHARRESLRAIKGKCRSELAVLLHRKRTPEVEFECFPLGARAVNNK